MTTTISKVLWSNRYAQEHERLMKECDRVSELGGTFSIENEWRCANWYTIFTFNYPDTKNDVSL